jgi:Na+-translocating ferredoxin:NAD+ oxidoreductase RnfG subunit
MKEKYLKFKYFKPAIVLGLITTVICALLIVTSSLLPDTSGELTDKLHKACAELMGEGTFYISEDHAVTFENINKVIFKNEDKSTAFEITVGGFKPPDGITLLIAMNPDGTVRGVIPLQIKDDPGIGTRINDAKFLAQFVNADADSEFDGITGATYSARGVMEAVKIAVKAYENLWVIQ